MLPVETPPDRSCSSNVSVAVRRSYERASDSGTLLEADPTASLNLAHQKSKTTHFSIRDYAFTSRSKDIGINWPFRRQYLQVCMKHGVKDLLPPFEPPDLVRANCSTKGKRSEPLVASIDDARRLKSGLTEKKPISKLDIISEDKQPEHHLLSSTSDLLSLDKTFASVPFLLSKDESRVQCGETEIELTVSDPDFAKRDQSLPSEAPHSEIGSVSQSEVTLEASLAKLLPLPGRLDAVPKPSQKKSRLVLKVASLEPLRSSDISSTSSLVSDSMASKVCPVCKTFSSTSNTTLNAHIDQCLFENTNNQVPSKSLNHKTKPSKKRLMVDIYATAAPCTLEDLDKRNGTTWSLDLRSMAQTNMVSTETKKPKICPVPSNDDDNNGAVYVDSSGTKICILSKLNTKPLDTVEESSEVKTHKREIENQNKLFFCKRRGPTLKHSTLMKVKLQGKKTSSANDKVKVASEDNLPDDVDLVKDKPLSLKPRTERVNCRTATLRQKIRSVQSGPSKRLNCSRDHDMSQKQVVEANRSDSVSFSMTKIHVGKLQEPVTDINFLKTKSMKNLSGTLLGRDSSAKQDVSPENNAGKLVSGLSSNCSRSLGGSSSSPSIRTADILKKVVKKDDKVPDLASRATRSCHVNLAEEKHNSVSTECPSSLVKSSVLSEDDCNSQKAQFASKKLRSPRSMKKFSKETRCVVNYEFHKVFELPSPSNHQAFATDQLSLCEEILTEPVIVCRQLSSRQSTSTVVVERKSSEGPELQGGCHNLDRTSAGLSTNFGDGNDVYNGGKPQLNGTTGSYSDTEIVVPETARLHTCNDNMDTDSGLGENQKLIGGTEAWVELFASRTSSNQRLHCGDEGSDMVMNPNGEVADEMKFRGREDACSEVQYNEFQNDHNEHIRISNACLTSPKISCLDIPLEHSCVTSNRTRTNDDHNIITEKETSGSPISSASTISHPSDDLKDREEKNLVIPSATRDCSRAEFHENLELPSTSNSMTDGTASIWKQFQGSKSNIMVHGSENLWETQSCCCSHREIFPHESRLSALRSLDKYVVVPSNSCFTSMPVGPSGYNIHADMGVETTRADLMSPGSCSNKPFGYRTCKEFVSDAPNSQLQTQSSPKPVLRLMGKNLTLANEDEHLQLIKESPSSNNIPELERQQPFLLGLSSNGSFPISNNHQFQNLQFTEAYELMGYGTKPSSQALPVSSFVGTTQQDQINTHQRMFGEASSSTFTCNDNGVLLRHQHQERPYLTRPSGHSREVLMVDDSPDPKILPRGCQPSTSTIYSGAPSGPHPMHIIPSCIQTPYTYLSRDLSYTQNPGFSVSYLRSSNVHSMLRRYPSEAPSAVPSSLSAGYLTPTYFYSPSLQQRQ